MTRLLLISLLLLTSIAKAENWLDQCRSANTELLADFSVPPYSRPRFTAVSKPEQFWSGIWHGNKILIPRVNFTNIVVNRISLNESTIMLWGDEVVIFLTRNNFSNWSFQYPDFEGLETDYLIPDLIDDAINSKQAKLHCFEDTTINDVKLLLALTITQLIFPIADKVEYVGKANNSKGWVLKSTRSKESVTWSSIFPLNRVENTIFSIKQTLRKNGKKFIYGNLLTLENTDAIEPVPLLIQKLLDAFSNEDFEAIKLLSKEGNIRLRDRRDIPRLSAKEIRERLEGHKSNKSIQPDVASPDR